MTNIANKYENQPIQFRAVTHRGIEVWLVTFKYSREWYHRCKRMGGRYSRTHKGWWWPKAELSKKEIREKLSCKHKKPSEYKEPI